MGVLHYLYKFIPIILAGVGLIALSFPASAEESAGEQQPAYERVKAKYADDYKPGEKPGENVETKNEPAGQDYETMKGKYAGDYLRDKSKKPVPGVDIPGRRKLYIVNVYVGNEEKVYKFTNKEEADAFKRELARIKQNFNQQALNQFLQGNPPSNSRTPAGTGLPAQSFPAAEHAASVPRWIYGVAALLVIAIVGLIAFRFTVLATPKQENPD